MNLIAGRLMQLAGDAILIVTVLFIGTVAAVRLAPAGWPDEIMPVLHVATVLESIFGVLWWGVATVLGVVLGWSVGQAGRVLVSRASVRWGGYH